MNDRYDDNDVDDGDDDDVDDGDGQSADNNLPVFFFQPASPGHPSKRCASFSFIFPSIHHQSLFPFHDISFIILLSLHLSISYLALFISSASSMRTISRGTNVCVASFLGVTFGGQRPNPHQPYHPPN